MTTATGPAFELPEMGDVTNLLVNRLAETTLQPDSPVICINRGRKTLIDTYDGNHVPIPAGYFKTEYAAAQHFQKRLIVKGTRNFEIGGYVSWIGILGSEDRRVKVDDEVNCQPFTNEQLQMFGEKIEGLDRSALGGGTVAIPVAQAQAMSRGMGIRPVIDAGTQATDGAAANAGHVFEPPAENYAAQDAAEARGATAGAEPEPGGDLPQPRPMRKANRR